MGIKVDRWGNVWNEDDTEHLRPAWPHPELLASQARCPCVKEYVFRTQTPQGEFEWRCACGKVFPGLHH
jgi:hypothetical protein